MDGAAPPPPADASQGTTAHAALAPRDFTRSEALRTPAFWLVTLGVANQSMVGTGIVFHIVSLGAEAGLSEPQAVAIFLPIALISAPVGFAAGGAADRYPVRFLMMGMMLTQLAMFVGAANLASPWLRAVAIGGWGVSAGFFGPLTVAALPGFFGRTHLGAIQGAMMMVLVVGSALGPSLLATFHLLLGSYAPGLYASCLLPGAVLLAAPFVRDPAAPAGA